MSEQPVIEGKKLRPWQAVKVRVATNEAGDEICKLLVNNQVPAVLTNVDWSNVFPYWLIATIGDRVIGCVQLGPSKPYGYLDFLYVAPDVSKGVRAVCVKKLLLVGIGQLREMGSELAIGFVENQLKSYKAVLKNNGVVIGPQGNCVVKRIV